MASAAIGNMDHHVGMIGPNAITRILEALNVVESPQSVRRIFKASGLEAYLFKQPTEMVDEREVMRLHRVLHQDLGGDRARYIGRIAGGLTAEYLLRSRIPRPAQIALGYFPTSISSRLLAKAIAKNAWTFVGTGTFLVSHGRPIIFTIRKCPICREQRATAPYCDFYAATFEHLYSRLVNERARVTEVSCQAMGDEECKFRINWQEF